MDASRLVLLAFLLTSSPACSATPTCEDYDKESFYLLEGESFYFVPYVFAIIKRPPDEEFTWYKNNTRVEFSDGRDRTRCRGAALLLLNLLPEDSGLYTARHVDPSGVCSRYHVNVSVVKTSDRNSSELFYGSIENSDDNKQLPCPDPVRKTCDVFQGNFTWLKDFGLLKGEHENRLWVKQATKRDEGVYTCVCAWTYDSETRNSSGSRVMTVKNKFTSNLQIISPIISEQVADEGSEIRLNCTIFCGMDTEESCHAAWMVNGEAARETDRYKLNVTGTPSRVTTRTAILTITKVTAADFRVKFVCSGKNLYSSNKTALRLTRRDSIIPLVMWKISVLCICVLAVALVKCFMIDLTLFFRPYLPASRYKTDGSAYDAYVVYQSQGLDKAAEDTLYRFVTNILPSVLEEKCGYQLFIHGRDDIPGEDLTELVEERMARSSRLMLILTLDSQSRPHVTKNTPACLQSSAMGGFDWQVGFHRALMQTGVKVILIQLGDAGPQEYSMLPPSLQHLIRKSPPIRWPEASRAASAWNGPFWKRVRYLMPAVPARRRGQASAI